MKPSFAFLATLVLASCQTTTGGTPDPNAVTRLPAECVFRAAFPGPAIYMSKSGEKNIPRTATVSMQAEGVVYDLMCACDDNWKMWNANEKEAALGINTLMSKYEWKRSEGSMEQNYGEKIYSFMSKRDGMYGEENYTGRAYFHDRCMTIVGARTRPSEVTKAAKFLETVYNYKRQPEGARSSATAPSPAPASTESRLATIKDLLDRKVITQQEYDERRRAILGSL